MGTAVVNNPANTWILMTVFGILLLLLFVYCLVRRKAGFPGTELPPEGTAPAIKQELPPPGEIEALRKEQESLKHLLMERESHLSEEIRSRRLLLDIARMFTRTLDQSLLMPMILSRLKEVTSFSFAVIHMAGTDGTGLNVALSEGLPEEAAARIMEDGFDIPWLVAKTRKPLVISDASADPRFAPFTNRYPVGSAVFFPISSDEEIYGVVAFYSLKKAAYQVKDLEIISIIAENAAIAIKNARLYQQMDNRLHFVTSLWDITKRLSSSLSDPPTMEKVFEESLRTICGIFGAEKAVLLFFNTQKRLFAPQFFIGINQDEGQIFSEVLQMEGEALENPLREIYQDQVLPGKSLRQPFSGLPDRMPFSSLLWLPLSGHKAPIGGIVFLSPEKLKWSEEEIRWLDIFGNILASTYDHYLLLQELAGEKEHLQTLVENIPEGVFTTDLERRILSWNPAAERILGWKEGEVTGKRCAEILHINLDGELVCETDCVLARIKEEKTTIEGFQAYFIAADGRQVPVLTSVSPIQNPDGSIMGTIHLFRDITHEIEVDRLKEEFLAAVTHELRSPLVSIMGYSEILLNPKAGPLSETQRDYMESIFRCSRNLHMLINNILESTRIEAGKMIYNTAPFNLDSLVENIFGIFIPAARQKDISLEKQIPARIMINGDQERIKLVFSNLISNAIKFTANGGRIIVTAGEHRDKVQIKVRDTGKGIPREDFKRIFQKFSQAEGERGGTGLGLYIVRQVLEAHGEDITVESRIGEGTTFHFALARFSK